MAVRKFRARGAKSAEAYYRGKADEMRKSAEMATEPSIRERYLDLATEYENVLDLVMKARQPEE